MKKTPDPVNETAPGVVAASGTATHLVVGDDGTTTRLTVPTSTGAVSVNVTPTQIRRPWRSTVRTVFQLVIALATLAPFVAGGIYVDVDQAPVIVGQVLAVAATITRVMAVPQVEAFLRRWAPWLAAAPAVGKGA